MDMLFADVNDPLGSYHLSFKILHGAKPSTALLSLWWGTFCD
jgi:hypothetical protein